MLTGSASAIVPQDLCPGREGGSRAGWARPWPRVPNPGDLAVSGSPMQPFGTETRRHPRSGLAPTK